MNIQLRMDRWYVFSILFEIKTLKKWIWWMDLFGASWWMFCGGSVVGVQEMALTYMPWSPYKPLSFSFLFQSWSYALEYATQDNGKPLCSDSDTNKLASLTAGYLEWALASESGRHPRKTLELRDYNPLNKQLHTRTDFHTAQTGSARSVATEQDVYSCSGHLYSSSKQHQCSRLP